MSLCLKHSLILLQATSKRLVTNNYRAGSGRHPSQAASSYVDGRQSVEHADAVFSNSAADPASALSNLTDEPEDPRAPECHSEDS